MRDVAEISNPSLPTPSSSSSNSNLIQPLFTALGWKDLKPAIVAAEQADNLLALELQQAYDSYSTTPNEASQQRLQMALDQVIGELQADLARVKKLEKEAVKRLAKPQTNSSGYLASWGNWLKQSAQSFFGSDDASLVERYAGIAQQRQEGVETLSRLRATLKQKEENSTARVFMDAGQLPPTARRLLQTGSSTEIAGQFCPPSGRCDLSNLQEGLSGFSLQGEAAGDNSGYAISGVGDINGDGLEDLAVGAYLADPAGRSNAGKTYVVFGSNQTNAWNAGAFNLTSLMNGQRGFVLQGEVAGDQSGSSVSGGGDINGDGLDDLLVGAPYSNPVSRSDAGKTYVVFGSNQTNAWGTGIVDINSLMNGQRGFVLYGEAADDLSGSIVSSAGDINGDKFSEILVGAIGFNKDQFGICDGKAYVVFGSNQTNAWGTGAFNISSLMNGQRGFALLGNDGAGQFIGVVGSAGDINGDSLGDITVGTYFDDVVYVVFGSKNSTAWGSGSFNLNTLMDGRRGFKLQGTVGEYTGSAVSSRAGDINGDSLDDIVVGAYYGAPETRAQAGKTYVVFGSNQTNAWGSGSLNLVSLSDGQRGFMLQGESTGDYSGISVDNAGDFNKDGFADLLVGAYQADPASRANAGKSYVIFGSNQTGAWGSGVLNLTSLIDGQRGFMLQGEKAGDESALAVASAGDINGDGLKDLLIGAHLADIGNRNDTGKSYVVFGAAIKCQFNVNQLIVNRGVPVVLNSQNLNVTYTYPVRFNLSAITHGQFEYISNPGTAITAFNQAEAWSGLVQFVPDGTATPPTYSVEPIASRLIKFAPQAANISFFETLLLNNKLTIHQDESLVVNGANINITSSYAPNQINISISNLQHGQFVLMPLNNSVSQFKQSELLANQVLFVHDNSAITPSYNVTVSNPGASLSPNAAQITFYRRPVWLTNQLTLVQGSSLFLSASNINVTEDATPTSVTFTINNLQHGQFRLSPANNTITVFTQQQLSNGQVLFAHDQTGTAPSYQIILSDSYFALPPQPASVNFTALPPILGNNSLTVLQGQNRTLTTIDLSASDPDPTLNLGTLLFSVSNLQHGKFTLLGNSTMVTQFTQADVTSGKVVFSHDDSTIAPDYQISVRNQQASSAAGPATVTFHRRPVWLANEMTLTQGESLFLTPSQVNVTGEDNPRNVLFTINNLQHGQFYLNNTNNSISAFNQQQLIAGQVLFVHDKTINEPGYQLQLNNSYFMLSAVSASLNFTALPPVLVNNSLTVFQGHKKTLTSTELSAEDADPTFNLGTLIFTVSNIQHGQFSLANLTNITQFTQAQIASGQVAFTQDDSTSISSYDVSVSNGKHSSVPQAAMVSFDGRPVMFNNRLAIEKGESVVLAITDLRAIDDITLSSDILFHISNVQHGYFSQLQAPNTTITSFVQQRIRDAEIQFQHDGSLSPPAYTITAIDGSGLESFPSNAQVNFKSTSKTAEGIDLQKLYASVSSIGGIAVAIAGYLWWRRKVTAHRRGFELANTLRKAANLEYHDFMRFDGDVFKSKIENFLNKVDTIQPDFYKRLTPAEKKSFAVCITEILEQRKLLKPSGYGMGIYGWMLAFSVGWSQQLDLKKFEAQLTEIAQQAVTAWQAEESPTTRWPYFSPTTKDKVNAFCCARPSRAGMFARDKVRLSQGQSVALMELKHQAPAVSPAVSDRDDIVLSVGATSSSPRFFGASSTTSNQELAAFKQEVVSQFQQVSGQLQQVSEGMHHMHNGMQEITGNVKAIHEEVEQLKAETRPLLRGASSSSS